MEAFLDKFSLSFARFDPRGLSDHSPAMVNLGVEAVRISKSFQIFRHVINHLCFQTVVSEAWNEDVVGNPWYVVTTKLKRVKEALKRLNHEGENLHEAVFSARNNLLCFQEALP